ncbi:MAG: hypothetical protein HGB12_04285 [Bacteroidetes bacterium]|nr:hypothetical protein [Bacteroidota bacterium]
MKTDNEIVLKLSKSLFWDTDPNTIDSNKHASLIVERVLSMGTWEDFKKIIAYYSKERVAMYAAQLRYMDKIVLAFCVTYFNIPKENFRCYTQRQLHPTHWDY